MGVPKGLHVYDKIKLYAPYSNNLILKLDDKLFDMSYFATLKDPALLPGELELIWSSAEYVNHQIERLLNLKVFL